MILWYIQLIIYRNVGDINKALEYYLESLNILEELNDEKGIAIVLNNVATIYFNQDNKEKAKVADEAHKMAMKAKEEGKSINYKQFFMLDFIFSP